MENNEKKLRERIPVYVGSFNQPTYLRSIVDKLVQSDFRRVIVADNASSCPKTKDYLLECERHSDIAVWQLGQNIGPFETVERIQKMEGGQFLFSDPDIDLPLRLAEDFVSRLLSISQRYRCRKVGLALEIPPDNEVRKLAFSNPSLGRFTIRDWEKQFWELCLEKDVYRANVDTTFFFWNPEIRSDLRRRYSALRSSIRPRRLSRALPAIGQLDIRVAGEGFVARHLPWYKDDKFPEDEREYYIRTATRASTWLHGANN